MYNRNQVSICELTTALKDKAQFKHSSKSTVNSKVSKTDPINIIFLGGSVTEGYRTNHDCKAPYDKNRCSSCQGRYTDGLYYYFQSIVDPAVKVKMVMLTGGGWTSEVQADKVIDNLRKQGLVR